MAQTEDTELRDLVIEALEKNGSLAKIRALLRANVFMAFEDECEKLKHNISLDNILKVPEGILTLSLVHEFLEFCNLKNTLFVYMSETRQGREYTYEGHKSLSEKLHGFNHDQTKEPLLVTIIKNISNVCPKLLYNSNEKVNKDDQNCTYIVHEDSSQDSSSNQSNSQSDQSCDEKKKLHLRLPLDNSDTDTSSDSARDKTSSEYIPNEHIVLGDESEDDKSNISQQSNTSLENKKLQDSKQLEDPHRKIDQQYQIFEVAANTSSQSTSYIDLKPLNSFANKLFYTSDLKTEQPDPNLIMKEQEAAKIQNLPSPKADSESLTTLSEVPSISSKQNIHNTVMKKFLEETNKSAANTPEYTYDFSLSPPSNINTEQKISPGSVQENISMTNFESPRQNSQSSQSSVSISDVADLLELSEANSPLPHKVNNKHSNKNVLYDSVYEANILSLDKKTENNEKLKSESDDSEDFTESSIPSVSNLSLDIH